MSDGVRCMWMRGGTSKGGYFLAEDLPTDTAARDAFLLRVMGSPDPRQVDGMGGGDPLTSKVALVRVSDRPGVNVDYLFLQVMVDRAVVTDAQNCGNLLAGVGPFAIERGLVAAQEGETPVVIHMENSGQTAEVTVQTPGGRVSYAGDAMIDGVPGTSAPLPIAFRDIAGASCGALLPTGAACDQVDGFEVTMIDNGMPSVLIRAADLGLSGDETPEALEADQTLCKRLETLRFACGPRMNLGDVTDKSVPKMVMISTPKAGAITTRSFIPHRCHKAIGVLGAVSVATACLVPGSVAEGLARVDGGAKQALSIEHPSGETTVLATVENGQVTRAAILRTARKLMDGEVFA